MTNDRPQGYNGELRNMLKKKV